MRLIMHGLTLDMSLRRYGISQYIFSVEKSVAIPVVAEESMHSYRPLYKIN